jgi:hypothetical protein
MSMSAVDACFDRHRHQEFLKFLRQVAKACPRIKLHLFVDNYAPQPPAHRGHSRRYHRHDPRRCWSTISGTPARSSRKRSTSM